MRAASLALVLRQLRGKDPSSSAAASITHLSRWQAGVTPSRHYSTDGGDQDVTTIGSERVRQLADNILELTVLEASQLSEILRKKLGVQKPAFGAMPMMPMMGGPMPQSAAPAAEAAAPAEEVKEKTEFDVKLESFSADGKIKVIKEIRAITNLGLKEAKELVEKAPVLVKAGLSKADAEALQKQLEAVGGKVALL